MEASGPSAVSHTGSGRQIYPVPLSLNTPRAKEEGVFS